MTVEETIHVLLALVVGLVLGAVYFGGLWLTIRQMPNVSRPSLLFLASFVIRLVITFSVFYLVMGERWERAVACLVGMLIVRALLISRIRPSGQSTSKDATEVISP